LIIDDEEAILPPLVYEVLPQALKEGNWSALVPGYNLSEAPVQRAIMPYPYHNVRNFLEVVEYIWQSGHHLIQLAEPAKEWPCVFVKKSALDKTSPKMPLNTLWNLWASDGLIGIMKDVLVHRFGDYYSAPRTDLIDLIPDSARTILDVGCAFGYFGKALKAERACHITGVELNSVMAKHAAKIYDKVYNCPVEKVCFNQPFDVIICGDVIEHLHNPDFVLKQLAQSLTPGGVLIGSVPNTGHWSIVMDLAQGRFEMIPVGLLCMSHIRFFTETELRALLAKNGLKIDVLDRDSPPPTPNGERFISTLISAGMGDEVSLRTSEFRFRARKN
jgi:2-polyprenyl-3-methyl-5-hydroxy-6-metoxy-1,4-benzoquinol methylase